MARVRLPPDALGEQQSLGLALLRDVADAGARSRGAASARQRLAADADRCRRSAHGRRRAPRAGCPWPCPTSPPRPRISPLAEFELKCPRAPCCAGSRADSATSPVDRRLAGKPSSAFCRPVIRRTASRSRQLGGIGDAPPVRRCGASATRLQKRTTSSQRCEMNRTMPRLRRAAAPTRPASHATSLAPSAEVASSSSRTRGFRSTARTISSICCWPSGRSPTRAPGDDVETVPGKDFRGDAPHGAADRCCPRAVSGAAVRSRFCSTRQIANERQFLEHAGDAEGQRLVGVARRDRPAVEVDMASVRGDRAADDLDQGRLAGAVLADQAEHRARRRLEGDRLQRAGRAVGSCRCRRDEAWRSNIPWHR